MYAVLPQFSDFDKAKKHFLQKEQDVISRQDYYAKLKNALAQATDYKNTLDEIRAALPGEIFLPALIDFFDAKAQNNGLILKSFAPSQVPGSSEEDTDQKKAPSQDFLLSLSGDVLSFENFLKDIETSARLIQVEEINFHKSESNEASSEISLLVKVYY
ncbi:MAG: type 4a pilus biogenesis protein PilO [Candidatus Pacebacteria bacterium]|nr:type 4a pilus biogenesis protein PilO [Candidatus Paceibacterota bacterium]